jgi:hypothetical protein
VINVVTVGKEKKNEAGFIRKSNSKIDNLSGKGRAGGVDKVVGHGKEDSEQTDGLRVRSECFGRLDGGGHHGIFPKHRSK